MREIDVLKIVSAMDIGQPPARVEAAADEAIAACGGDMRSAIRALILANEFLEYELETRSRKDIYAA